jgi:hypothetical protein
MSYANVKFVVEQTLPKGLLDMWKTYFFSQPEMSKMWGSEQVTGFERKMITLCVYKDLVGIGYDKLLATCDVGFKINTKSLQHNHKLIRQLFRTWANTYIKNEKVEVWNDIANFLPKKKGLETVNLIMDSTDFRLFGRTSVLKKDSSWSYKLNGPRQRFQALVDAKKKFQGLWRGYSPKIYDGD